MPENFDFDVLADLVLEHADIVERIEEYCARFEEEYFGEPFPIDRPSDATMLREVAAEIRSKKPRP